MSKTEEKPKPKPKQDEWYIAKEGKQEGPFSLKQLQEMIAQGSLNAEDLVWKKDMPNWLVWTQIKELAGTKSIVVAPLQKPKYSSSKWDVMDFLTFRRMITPVIIQIIFWLGALMFVLTGISFIANGVSQDALSQVLTGLVILIICPLLVRVLCELMVLFFRMNETLTEIKEKIGDR